MQKFTVAKAELPALRKAARLLKQANTDLVKASTQADAAKERLARYLLYEWGLDIDDAPIGELMEIEGVALIEIAQQMRFDEKAFQLDQPTVHEEYKKAVPVRKFKPLV